MSSGVASPVITGSRLPVVDDLPLVREVFL